MCKHTSQAGLGRAFGRRLLCALGERVVADLVFALLDRNIIAFSVQKIPTQAIKQETML